MQLIEEIQKLQKSCIWNNLTPKIKHETLCNFFQEDGLKNVDIILRSQAFNAHELNDHMVISFINGKYKKKEKRREKKQTDKLELIKKLVR